MRHVRTSNYAAKVGQDNKRLVANRLALGDYMGSPSYAAIQHLGDVRGVKGKANNVRNLLMKVGGIGSYNVEMTIAQSFLMPRTTDPDNASTIILVEGVQRAINRVGGKVDVNGLLTPETVQALRTISGDTWMSKTWLQIYGDLAEMIKRRDFITPSGVRGQPRAAFGDDYITVGDAFTTVPLATLGVGAALLFLALR